ncbi:MAG TPA: hypothetical protein VGG75_04240 [Trebonia sp.]|jgi:hypothetical protein
MLKIDSQEVSVAHRGELRVVVAAVRPVGLGRVRAYLVADLLRRYAERSGLAPTVVDFAPDNESGLRDACDALNIHPPRHSLSRSEPTGDARREQLASMFHDGVREPVFDIGVRLVLDDAIVDSAPVHDQAVDETLATRWITLPLEPGEVKLGEEPLGVRLKLLGLGEDPVRTLGRWRAEVAMWARSPSGAMSRPHAAAIGAAFEDNLDSATAVAVLLDLEDDDSVPDGVKFETFAAADRMFGLDLARDIGK